MTEENRKGASLTGSEDWWALWIGLFIFVLGLFAMAKVDLLGWAMSASVWTDVGKAVAPVSKAFKMSGLASVFATYVFLLVVMSVGARSLRANMGRFVGGFTVIFWLSVVLWIIGHNALLAATPNAREKFGLAWSLGLTPEGGFILALIVGLVIGNFMPGVAAYLKEAARPEWYIKTAIVLIGVGLGVKAVDGLGLAATVLFRGLAAIAEAYLIYWAVVYLIARKWFRFSREWAAPLAAGISICGVSAAIAAAGAIRARAIVPVMISSLVIVFSVVEMFILPFAAQQFLYKEPMVAGAWMGLAVKTDGAALSSGAITDALVRAKAASALGINYEKDWMMMATTTTKVFIDMFIGIWAFLLALVWTYHIDRKPGETVRPVEIWHRFPKFVIGYVITFVVMLLIGLAGPDLLKAAKAVPPQTDALRVIFFTMTFLTIGMLSNFKVLRQEGLARMALVYGVSLFGFIIWIALVISWLFYHGVYPPVAAG